MIIVEGPDGAGKTTLIGQLIQRYELEVAPRVVSKDAEPLVDLRWWVDQNLAEGFQYKLFDRHRLISEFIYGPTLRQRQEPSFTNYLWVYHSIRRFYEHVDPIIIYCLPPLEVVAENIYNSGEENRVVLDHIEQIYTAYLERIAIDSYTRRFHTTIWDYTRDGAEDDPLTYFDPIMNYARGRAEINV